MKGRNGWHISAVEVKAFKSFSGATWARFEISNGFVGILGPNGSGKSNLLEAICFATGCSCTLLRGCRTLRDVTSTDAGSQLPEVHLEIKQGEGSRSAHHLLETSLTAEGTRAYKIDGRIKAATQVKDFLRSCGIVVDPTTVIQQASVTRLTDSNSLVSCPADPTTLSDLVAAASGLSSWNQETAAARSEIIRTRKVLRDIQSNITKVQSAAAADEAAIQATLEASRLEQELERVLEQLVAGMQQRQSALQQQLVAAKGQQQELQDADEKVTSDLQQTISKQQQLATKHANILADLEVRSSSTSASNLAGEIAAAESKVAVLQANAAAVSNLASNLEYCKQQLSQKESRVQQLESTLQARQKVAGEAKASLAAAELATSAAESLQQQLVRLQMQATSAATAVLQQQAIVASSTDELQQVMAKLAAAESRLQTLPAVPAASSVPAADAAAVAAAAAAHAQAQAVSHLQQHLSQLQMDLELAESALNHQHIAALLATCRGPSNHRSSGSSSSSSSDRIAVPMHACFQFKHAATDAQKAAMQQQLLVPLIVIAGPAILQVLVANSMKDANRILAAAAAGTGSSRGRSSSSRAGKLKIWPLENLRAHNNLIAQRAAQQQLGFDRVIIPLDLFEYDKQYEPAMIRAFGGYVIATDTATAARLVEQYGISSVDMQGTVSKKGSMSGGWTGSSGGYAKHYWSDKLQHDAIAAQLAAAKDQLQQETAKQQQLEGETAKAEQQLSAVQQQEAILQELNILQATAAAAEARLQQEQQQLTNLQQRHSELQERLQTCQSAANSNSSNKGGARAAAAEYKQQLHGDVSQAAAAAEEAQQELEEARDQVEQLLAELESLELQLGGSSIQQQHEQLHHLQQQLVQLRQQQTESAAAAVLLQEQQHAVQKDLGAIEQQLLQLQKQQQEVQQHMKVTAAQAAEAAAELKQLKSDMKQLAKDFADSDAVHTFVINSGQLVSTGGNRGSPAAYKTRVSSRDAISAKQLQQLLKSSKQLQQQIAILEVPELPTVQNELCQSRVLQVQQFRAQMAALEAAADGLEARIASTAEQVNAANDAVYEDIAAGFIQLCSSLLPSLEVQVDRTGSQAHEGLQFRFRRLEDSAGSSTSSSSTDWQTSLGQLSGGQQTLVSLAMLLAVARAGNGSRLFLLDEVDASLDEHNQARAAALLKQLANAADGSCQILCVTHNAAFQQVCDAYVHVVSGPHGGTLPAADAAVAAAADAGSTKHKFAAAAASKSKSRAAAAAKGSKKAKQGAAEAGGIRGAAAAGTGRSAKKVRFQTSL